MAPRNAIDHLTVIVYDGHFDKIHYALAMASSSAALDIPVTLFFTMSACRALMTSTDGLQPGWRALPVSEGDETGGDMDDRFREQKIAPFETLLSACVELGVTFMVCEMGLAARNLSADSLRHDIPVMPGGLVTLLSGTSQNGSVVFI